jgi:hypothetical protein
VAQLGGWAGCPSWGFTAASAPWRAPVAGEKADVRVLHLTAGNLYGGIERSLITISGFSLARREDAGA